MKCPYNKTGECPSEGGPASCGEGCLIDLSKGKRGLPRGTQRSGLVEMALAHLGMPLEDRRKLALQKLAMSA